MEIMGIKESNTVMINVYNSPSNLIDKEILAYITKFPNVIICGDLMLTTKYGMWEALTKMIIV